MKTTTEIFNAIVELLAALTIDGEPGSEKLFGKVLLHSDKKIMEALRDNLVVADRVCLFVPLAVRREIRDTAASVSVSGLKHAECAIIHSDRALFMSGQSVVFGSDKNPGLFAIDDAIEAALLGKEIVPGLGGILLGDSDPLLLTDKEQSADPGRHAMLMTALVPTGDLRVAVD